MGDRNQIHFLQRKGLVDGPVLEVGSKEYTQTPNFRGFFPDYVGVDLSPGKGVDVVADLAKSTEPLQEGHYALVICCSVLEHVAKPWELAGNLAKLLRPGGGIYLSVPWVWRFHAYPDDYWRMSWRAIETLFPQMRWEQPEYSTTREGDFFPAVPDADNNLAMGVEGRKFMPYLMLHMIGWNETNK